VSQIEENRADDLRVRRTQKMLRKALIELVHEKGFAAITVRMLAERAMINRATFYRHYADKFDLAEKVYAALDEEYWAAVQSASSADPQEAWLLLMQHLATYADFYLGLVSDIPHFQNRVCDRIEQQLHAEFVRLGLDETQVSLPLPLILRYLATAQMGIIQWWLEEGQPISAAEMAHCLLQLHLHGGIQPLHLPVPFSQTLVRDK